MIILVITEELFLYSYIPMRRIITRLGDNISFLFKGDSYSTIRSLNKKIGCYLNTIFMKQYIIKQENWLLFK